MRWFILLLLLATVGAYAQAPAIEPALPWARAPIAAIEGTNKVPERIKILTPREQALLQLHPDATNAAPAGTNALGSIQRIYGIVATTSSVMDAAAMLEAGRAQKVMDYADDLFRRGQLELAFSAITNELGRITHRGPRSILLSKLGAYHFRMQRYAAAAQAFDEARKNSPLDNGTLCNYAACRLMMNEVDVAERLYKSMNLSSIRDRKLLFSIFFNLGCIKSLQSDLNLSIDYLKRAAAADPASTLAAMGDPQLDSVRLDVAFLALQQNLEQFINNPAQQGALRQALPQENE